jgi:hypothetical protein
VTIEDEIDFATGRATGKKTVNVLPFETVTVALPDEVCDRFYFYHDGLLEIAAASGNDDVDGNYGRFAEKAFRIALLLASVEGASRIELRHWTRAQQITERWRAGLHSLIEQLSQPEPSAAVDNEEKIFEHVRKLGGATANEVSRYIKHLSSGEIAQYMASMATAGRLKPDTTTRKGTLRYVIV